MIISFTDFTTKLAFQQLKNTALVSDQDTGTIDPSHTDQILNLVNQGLKDISTRMKLLESQAVLSFVTGQNIYTLDEVNYPEFIRLLSVDAVYRGNDVIEDNKRTFIPKSNKQITQPSPTTVRFSDQFMEDYGPAVDLHFQKYHPEITEVGNIDLPPNLHETLALYVSGLYLAHMGGEENKATGDSYYGLYLRMVSDDIIENKSGTSEVVDEDTRFQDRGFV